MDLSSSVKIKTRQICEDDLSALADLLARGFRGRPREFWLRILTCLAERPSLCGLPKYGYLLESDGAIVGVILLIFSTVRVGNASTIRCNVSSWYVEPAFRSYASLFVNKALSHRNVTYLNVTPAPHTRPILHAQGYSRFNKGIFISVPALQLRFDDARVRITQSRKHAAAQLEPFENTLLLEHAEFGCLSLWCETADGVYPFVFRPRVIKCVATCVQLVYCRNVGDFVRFAGPVGRFLALRGRPLVLIDANGPIPGLIGKYFDSKMPKYFKGPDLPRLGDLAYTEVAMFGV